MKAGGLAMRDAADVLSTPPGCGRCRSEGRITIAGCTYRHSRFGHGSVEPSEVVMKAATWLCAVALCGALAGCGDDGTGTSVAGVCESYCATLDECGYGLNSGPCQSTCESQAQTAASISSACGSAASAEGRCIGALSCEALEVWVDDGPDAPCQAEDAATDAACN